METEGKTLCLGRLKMTLEALKDVQANPSIRGVLANFIILEATTDWDKEVVDYIAMSDLFEPIKENDVIPSYIMESKLELNEKQEKHYSFKVVKQ
jgi:hypothetical protein